MEEKVYKHIARAIEDDILSGTLREGSTAPSTHETAARFDVSPATAARGITQLSEAGLLYKQRGIGLFVVEGARDMIWEKRRNAFKNEVLPGLIAEAQKIGISRQEFIAMILSS